MESKQLIGVHLRSSAAHLLFSAACETSFLQSGDPLTNGNPLDL
jgi:hypothetical protein